MVGRKILVTESATKAATSHSIIRNQQALRKMDTGNLSEDAYHDLTLQFGLLSYECQNETIFLRDQ